MALHLHNFGTEHHRKNVLQAPMKRRYCTRHSIGVSQDSK